MQELAESRAGGVIERSREAAVEWSLARKVSVALLAILACTLLLTTFIGYGKFQRVFSDLVNSRYSVVVGTIKNKVEDSLNLGLALRQLRLVQETIEREKARDPLISSIEVFDAKGELLFDTDRGAIGNEAPDAWQEALKAASGQPFSLPDEDSLIVGMPLLNSLGKVEGAVVLRYPAAYLEREVGGMVLALLGRAGLLLAGFGVAAVIGLYLLFGQVRGRLAAMEDTLVQVLDKGGEPPALNAGETFDQRFDEFVARTREAVDHIRDATQEVERLDRLA